jgi:hypothetical protein
MARAFAVMTDIRCGPGLGRLSCYSLGDPAMLCLSELLVCMYASRLLCLCSCKGLHHGDRGRAEVWPQIPTCHTQMRRHRYEQTVGGQKQFLWSQTLC